MDEMQNKVVDGVAFQRLVLSGAANLKAHARTVDELNVFPIPDGDTGENMCMTISGGLDGMKNVAANSVQEKAKALSDGMLLNARGNSGVILSQLFRGMAEGFIGVERATLHDVAAALDRGVECAYKAVVNPVEGTILTVAREAAAYARKRITPDSSLESFALDYFTEAKASLKRTPELLAVLKEAGVTDSGGAGLMYIAEGTLSAVRGEDVIDNSIEQTVKTEIDFDKFTEDSVMEFGYCTEILLRLQRSKTNLETFTPQIFVDYLTSIGGDSIVAFVTGTVLKVHVHTMTPWKVLEFAQRYGEFLTVKIENMTLQHNETTVVKKGERLIDDDDLRVEKPRKKFGLVTVATGEGLISAFKECGADVVIDGGQGKNPSADDFMHAFDQTNADHIFVLPNNGNIILAARQAAELYDKSDIIIIESKNIGQAYSALTLLDYSEDDAEKIAQKLREDMSDVSTGMITCSVRDAHLNGVDISSGDYIGFTDKTMLVSEKKKEDAFKGLAEKMKVGEHEFCIAVFGKEANEDERNEAESYISKNYPMVEFYSIDGGQDVYDYILILE